jgi:hypothetical protein
MPSKKRDRKRRKKEKTKRAERPRATGIIESLLSPRILTFAAIVMLAVMALLRFFYFLEVGENVIKAADTDYFLETGKKIAGGDVFLDGQSLIFSPLYSYFLGSVLVFFGESFGWVLAIQFLLGILAAYLLYLLAKELFGPVAALCTLGLHCLYGFILFYEGQLLDAHFSVIIPVIILLSLRGASKSGHYLYWASSGFSLGLFALTRPNVLLFLPVAAGWAFWDSRDRWSGFRRWWPSTLLVAGAALCIFPFTARNWIVTGEPVLITAHGGINFYTGNNEKATGIYRPPDGMSPVPGAFNLEISRQVAEEETGRSDMTDHEVSSYWFGKASAFIRSHPGRFIQLLLKKCLIFFNGYEVELNTEFYFFKNVSHILKIAWIPLGLVMPLGLLGMALALRCWREHMIFYLFVLCYSLSVVLFFVSARYRLPIVPVFLLYGGFALKTVMANVKQPLKFGLLLLAGGVLALFVNLKPPVQLNQAVLAHNEGYNFAAMGRLNEAIKSYKDALRLNPELAATHMNMAMVYKKLGEVDKAGYHLREALKISPKDEVLGQQVANLGLELFRRGRERRLTIFARCWKLVRRFHRFTMT